MTLFSYRAINNDGKEVRGTLESVDEDSARTALLDLHLEVLDVSEASRNKPIPTALPQQSTFSFEGRDAQGNVRQGTVQAASKFEAFNRLKTQQQLAVSSLSPMGTLPKYNDPDLDAWQKQAASAPSSSQASQVSSAGSLPLAPAKNLSFTQAPPVTPEKIQEDVALKTIGDTHQYHPLLRTLHLYAGWLLAWYGLFVALGYYALTRSLPWDIPFVQAFTASPLILSFMAVIFLFLLSVNIHRALRAGMLGGMALLTLSGGIFWIVRTALYM